MTQTSKKNQTGWFNLWFFDSPIMSQQPNSGKNNGDDKQLIQNSTMQSTPSIPNMPTLPTYPQNIEQAMESGSRANRYLTDYAMASASLERSRSNTAGSQTNIIKIEATKIMQESIDSSYVIPFFKQSDCARINKNNKQITNNKI